MHYLLHNIIWIGRCDEGLAKSLYRWESNQSIIHITRNHALSNPYVYPTVNKEYLLLFCC